tara:strand:- start:1592 stop:2743 length:1152 start_codon:yes stop_codon:yes gene_type:complete
MGLPSDGVAPETIVGSKHGGTFTVSMPLRGQSAAYDATGAIAVNPEMTLLADLVGGSYTAAPVADAIDSTGTNDANTLAMNTPGGETVTMSPGAFQAVGNAGTKATTWAGYVKSQTGVAVEAFEDSTIQALASNDDIFGSYTVYPGGAQPTARSFKIVGKESTQGLVLIGCIPENGSISLENGKVPMLEVTYRFTDYKYDTTSEGLQSAAAFTRLPPVLGSSKGRVWLGGGVKESGVGESNGTAETEGTCGVGSFKVDINCEVYEIPCHGAAQGVSQVVVGKRNISTSFTIPHIAAYIDSDGGDSKWGVSLSDQKAWSVSLMLGTTAGKMFSVLIPAAVCTVQPEQGDVDGIQAFTLEFQPIAYTADGASANAGDSPFRIGFA